MRDEGVMDEAERPVHQATPKAKQHTKKFFASCTQRTVSMREMRKAKEARKYEDRIRMEVDKRWRDHMAMYPPTPIPRPSQQEPELPVEEVAPPSRQLDPSNPADSASIEYSRWCFHGEEKAEELPSWEIRHRLHCRGRRR